MADGASVDAKSGGKLLSTAGGAGTANVATAGGEEGDGVAPGDAADLAGNLREEVLELFRLPIPSAFLSEKRLRIP